MKREEVKSIFPDATEEQIDSILNASHAEANSAKRTLKENETTLESLKEQLNTVTTQLVSYKNENESLQAKVQSSMSAEELLAEREKQAEEREREYRVKMNTLDAKEIFQNAGLNLDDYADLVTSVVSDDTERTKSLAEQIANLTVKQREIVKKETADEMVKSNPSPTGSGTGDTVTTKAEFLKLTTAQQMEIMDSNPNVLQELKD